MATIPARKFVAVNPNVLNAGGNGLQLIGLMLTTSSRVPTGGFLSFPTPLAVGAYFSQSSNEYNEAVVYFNGFTNATLRPGALLFAQYNQNDVAAYVRGSNAGLTVAQLKLLNQAITITVDGYAYTSGGNVSLSSATSYSSAAGLIQTALNTTLPAGSSFTAAIAPATFSITASINGGLMTVTNVASGAIISGAIISGAGVTSGTQVGTQLSGAAGGVGVYAVSVYQSVASTTVSGSYGTMTVSGTPTGTLAVGQVVVGAASGTQIGQLGTGTGAAGTYFVNKTQTVASTSLTTTAPPLAVTYDSVSSGFVITSGSIGVGSTVAFPAGALATSLFLTSALGAVLSQGANAAVPAAFMNGITAQTTNWATFMTTFDPDGGSGNAVKQQFSAWVNGTDDEFTYVAWDTDVTPTLSTAASSSLGYILEQSQSSGTICVWEPAGQNLRHAAFVCGMVASINFTITNGRITVAFKGQSGITAAVTSETVADNLEANGYNYVGATATAAQGFVFFYPGTVSGNYEWADAYVNQIWLNAALQLALLELLTQVNSVPYNTEGYGLIEAAMLDPINAALLCGVIRTGIPLSSAQTAELLFAAGVNIGPTITAQGYYIQVLPASPQVRQARQSPPISLFFTDGGSVQQITLSSVDVM